MTDDTKYRITVFGVAIAVGLLWDFGKQVMALGIIVMYFGQLVTWIVGRLK